MITLMEPVAALGFVVGMRHALEADHVAAVATLATRGMGSFGTLRLGALWGLGHATAVLTIGTGILFGGAQLPKSWSLPFELLVGVMLVMLGIGALQRRKAATAPPSRKPLLVGIVHGMAGSAALMLLAASSAGSAWLGLLNLCLFSAGSVAGMVLLSSVLSLPLRLAATRAPMIFGTLSAIVGIVTATLGIWLLLNQVLSVVGPMTWPMLLGQA